MGGKTEIVKGRIEEAAGALTDNDNLRAKGQADQVVGKVEAATQKVVDKVKKAARKVVGKVKGARTLLFIAAMSAAVALPGSIVLAKEGGGGHGGGGHGSGGGGGHAGASGGAGASARNGGGAATAHVGVVRNGSGAANPSGGNGFAHALPSFVQSNFSSQHLAGSRNALSGNAVARNVNLNTNNAILHNSQLSGQHWNGNWNNSHNNGYWNNRSFFFGGGSPFGYGNGAYAYGNNPYSYGFGGLGYGLGGLGLGGFGLGGYGGYGGGGYGNYGGGGYGGSPSYGYDNNGANAYTANQGALNNDNNALALAPSPAQPADDALDFAGHGELDFKAGSYEGAVRNWKHALVEDPNNGALVLLMAQGLFEMAQYDQAAGATQMAMQMLPQEKWGAVIENYKELYGNIGDYTNQLKALEKARDAKPTDSALRFLLGFHFGYLGHPKEAVRELDKTLELNAKDEGARKVRDIFAAKLGIAPSVPAPSPSGTVPAAASTQAAPRQAGQPVVVGDDSISK